MTEHVERLRATIRELEAELRDIDTVDAETRRLLEEALQDIDTKIRERSNLPPAESLDDDLLSRRVSGAAERFESTHPTLFGVLTRLAEGLARMGI